MLMRIRHSLNIKNELDWFWGIALLAIVIEFCFHILLPVSISNDSYGYLYLSQHIGEAAVFERSLGYPMFLTIFGMNHLDTMTLVILMQAMLAVAVPLLIFKTLHQLGLVFAVLGALIACIYFYNFIVSLSILTEPLYVFAIAVYAFFLVRYFNDMNILNLLFVIASCWLIALIRVDCTMYFISLLIGMGCYIVVNYVSKNPAQTKLGLQYFFVAVFVFVSISFIQSKITNRTSAIIWPHFVFNWAYSDYDNYRADHANYGIVKQENGPAAKRLFTEIEKIVTDSPSAFNTLKEGGSEKIKLLVPEANGKYSSASIALLMDDLNTNTAHVIRSYWMEGIMIGAPHLGIVQTSKILGDAIMEAFKKHPEVLLKRVGLVIQYWWDFMIHGIKANDLIFPSAYNQQIPAVMNDAPSSSLRPGFYKQWANDLYRHTGHAPLVREFIYPDKFPTSLQGAVSNIASENAIGFGHYIGFLGLQILRLCWLFIMIGIVGFPFFHRYKPLLAALLSASVIPPFCAVFFSEVDTRHFLMTSPVQIVTACVVIYLILELRRKSHA